MMSGGGGERPVDVSSLTVGEFIVRLEAEREMLDNAIRLLRQMTGWVNGREPPSLATAPPLTQTLGGRALPPVPAHAPVQTPVLTSTPWTTVPPSAPKSGRKKPMHVLPERWVEARRWFEDEGVPIATISRRLLVSEPTVHARKKLEEWVRHVPRKQDFPPLPSPPIKVPRVSPKAYVRTVEAHQCRCGATVTQEPCPRCGRRTPPA